MTVAPAAPAEVSESAPGWGSLINAARRLSTSNGALTVRRHDIKGGLLFDVDAASADQDSQERVRGIVAAIHAASTETCSTCGGPGDPITLESGRRSTRCAGCRGPGDEVRPRPPWRRERDPHDGQAHAGRLVEDIVGLEDLAALMDARETPAHAWPVKWVNHGGMMSGVGASGWNHLMRAALRLLLPLECPGSNPVWRLGQLKEKAGRLIIYHAEYTPFLQGITNAMREVSATVCWHCGRPGRPLTAQRPIQPACRRCDRWGYL